MAISTEGQFALEKMLSILPELRDGIVEAFNELNGTIQKVLETEGDMEALLALVVSSAKLATRCKPADGVMTSLVHCLVSEFPELGERMITDIVLGDKYA
jgi:hypothetical protein